MRDYLSFMQRANASLDMAEKCGEDLANILPISILRFPGKVATGDLTQKVFHTFHEARNKILSPLDSGS